MNYNTTDNDIGTHLYDPRGDGHLTRDDPTAPGTQQGGPLTGATVSERATQSASPGGSVRTTAGLIATRAEQGTEDAPRGDTTSGNGDRLRPTAPPTSGNRPKNRKPLIQVATLNVRGCGNPRRADRHKLSEVIRWMRSEKVGVVGLQETYECTENFAVAERANGKVWSFPNPGTRHSAGTGFLVHREGVQADLTKDDFTHEVLIQGRLDTLSWKWGGETITIANLYAPNSDQAAITFFEEVVRLLKRKKVDVVLGDWNHVEHKEDRLPSQRNPPSCTKEALRDLRTKLGIKDAWREANPTKSEFTWESPHPNADGSTSRSRLDRILLTDEISDRTTEHSVDVSLTVSDHYPVRVKIVDDESPYIGETRWRMNLEDLDDEVAMDQVRQILIKCEEKSLRDPMAHWLAAKKSIRNVLTDRQTMRRKERGKHLSALKTRREKLTRRSDFTRNPGLQHEEGLLRERIANLSKAKLDRAAESSAARYAESGESVNKYWFNIGKSIRQSSVIRSLSGEDGHDERDTFAMAEIARKHHEKLQSAPEMTTARAEAIHRMRETTSGKRMTPEAKVEMGAEMSERDARDAIAASQCGKAPGKDGLPYELYKYWVKRYEEPVRDGPRIPNIARILARVWNSIRNGEGAPAEYVEGLMFLLYKKKRRDKIENYRPITLLGCDYKLQTKAMTTRLGRNVQNMIHPDQAGFVPGRDILDHVKLAKHVAEYCDTVERDGCLVALDQEKAYDRISHSYLWEILDAFGLPESFIRVVKALYQNASTTILVNQTESAPFEVNRGVRQGDPISCLLFNLAIEPLAESLRRSTLRGVHIPNVVERLVVRLFADNTQIFLSKNDKWTQVKEVTDLWCLASTAKFNEGKTEFLPMGSPGYRKEVCRLKFLQPARIRTSEALPREARFVKDHEPLRILGGIVGHKVDEAQVWEPVTSAIERLADKWSARRLTMKGRRLIISFILQSKAQYLMMTNDPPSSVVARVSKATHKVMWAGKKRGLTTMPEVERPVTEGGLGVPNFVYRARASRLMTAKKWAAPDESRPLWADVVSEMIRLSSKRPDDPRKSSLLHQTWKETTGKTSTLPRDVQAMLKETRRYNLRVEALKISQQVKDDFPVWMSTTVDCDAKTENSAPMRRLRTFHGVWTAGDLRRVTHNAEGCRKHLQCLEAVAKLVVKTTPRSNIRFNTPFLDGRNAPDGLDFTARRRRAAKEDASAGRPTLLNPDVTHRGDLRGAIRVFQAPPDRDVLPAYRQGQPRSSDEVLEIWTDGSATGVDTAEARVGFGVWTNHNWMNASRLTSPPVTNNRAELAAVVWALEKAPGNVAVTIYSDSQYVVGGFSSTHVSWEDDGWLGVQNGDLWRRGLYLMRARTAETVIAKVKAHAGIFGNEMADQLAKLGAESSGEDMPSMDVPANWILRGAKLSTLTFSKMYEWVRSESAPGRRTHANENIPRVIECLREVHGQALTEARIWLSLRKPYIRREISDFLWTMIHGRSQCGTMFRNWGGEWEDLQFCDCGALESMEHILTECSNSIWRMRLWDEMVLLMKRSRLIPEAKCRPPTFEEIMGVGAIKVVNATSTRLWATLVSETAFAVWKTRNRARFDEIRISQRMAIDLWRSSLEKRAKTDLALTRLKGPMTYLDDRKRREIATAWNSLLAVKGGVTVWNSADYG